MLAPSHQSHQFLCPLAKLPRIPFERLRFELCSQRRTVPIAPGTSQCRFEKEGETVPVTLRCDSNLEEQGWSGCGRGEYGCFLCPLGP